MEVVIIFDMPAYLFVCLFLFVFLAAGQICLVYNPWSCMIICRLVVDVLAFPAIDVAVAAAVVVLLYVAAVHGADVAVAVVVLLLQCCRCPWGC